MEMPVPVTDNREVVAAIRAVPGVAGAEIEPDEGGGPGVRRLPRAAGCEAAPAATDWRRLPGPGVRQVAVPGRTGRPRH